MAKVTSVVCLNLPKNTATRSPVLIARLFRFSFLRACSESSIYLFIYYLLSLHAQLAFNRNPYRSLA